MTVLKKKWFWMRLRIAIALLIFLTPTTHVYAQCAYPSGVEAEIVMNSEYKVPQYCDGYEWIAMVGGEEEIYRPNAVEFANAGDYLRQGSPIADSKEITISTWIKKEDEGTRNIIEQFTNDFYFGVSSSGSAYLLVHGVTTANKIREISTSSDTINIGRWHHVLISANVAGADPSNVQVYVDDVAVLATVSTLIDDTFDFSGIFDIFENRDGDGWIGPLADLWIDNTYTDLSIEANRRAFMDANGNPLILGADGSLPTGSPPDIF